MPEGWLAMPRRRSFRLVLGLVGLAGSAVFVALAFRRLDFASVLSTWKTAHLFPWLPFMVASYLLGHVVRGQRLRVLVRRETFLPLPTASNIVVVGYASNNVFPMTATCTRPWVAPNAMRIPISCVRWVTEYEITP